MGIFDRALKGLDVEALSAKLTAAVHSALNAQGHAMQTGLTNASWWVECLNTDCDFYANGNRGGDTGQLACDKMAEVHLMELKDG